MNQIAYKSGYRYQLVRDYHCHVDIYPTEDCFSEYITLDKNGNLTIHRGYSWDGPSGCTIDTKNFMRGSLIHDSLYQLLREGLLPKEYREQADKELKKACLQDGMSRLRAWYVYTAVKHFAGYAADPSNRKKVLTAP
jgi:hypothetical protein